MRALRRVRVKDGRNQNRQANRFASGSPASNLSREQVSAWWGNQLDK